MARKYFFKFADDVPSEIRASLPEFVEAGPTTISAYINGYIKLGPEYDVIEDEHEYVLHVRKSKKPKKAA